MHIQKIKNFQCDKINSKTMYLQNFNGNINKTVHMLQLGTKELSSITQISNQCKRLNILFQSSGSYLTDLFKKSVAFLVPFGITGFVLKDTLNSDEVSDVKIEKDLGQEKNDELITLTLGNKEDVAKIIVTKNGVAQVVVDEDLSQDDLNKYLTEINQNRDKLIEAISEKTETATRFIDSILKDNSFNGTDLSSPEQVQNAVMRFIDDRKRVTILSQLVDRPRFIKQFAKENNKTSIANKGSLNNGDKEFSFQSLENQYFRGICLIVTDNIARKKQWFIAMDDGNVYKSPILVSDIPVPKHFLESDNLTALTSDELKSSELNYMFNYACAHINSVCKGMLRRFSERKIISTETLKQFNNELDKKTKVITEKPFSEESAKTVKIYDLDPNLMDKMKEIEDLMHRIAYAYSRGSRRQEKLDNMTEKSGLLRRKFVNGYIIKDTLLTDKMSLGIAKHSSAGKNEALFNFEIFDENNNEIARLKILNSNKAKLLVKPTASVELANAIEEFLKYEFENGLIKRVLTRLNEACYYHENYVKVNGYIAKSYFPITTLQAVRELLSEKSFYKFNNRKINKIKKVTEDLAKLYAEHPSRTIRVQEAFFPEPHPNTKRFLCGKINELNLRYEAILLEKSNLTGIRILTRNINGKITNCFVIEDDGTTYKLIHLPKDNYARNLVMERSNFTQLDEDAVKKEHLDLIFKHLYNTVTVYNDFVQECINHPRALSDDYITEKVREYKTLLKTKNAKTSIIFNETSKLPKIDIPAYSTPLSEELKERYEKMLTPKGDFKSLEKISIAAVVEQLDRIFSASYEERSPHLIHDLKSDGNIFLNRFSVLAPDGAWITVTKNKTNEYREFIYYSIRVQKDDEVMYLKINPEEATILRCDKNNSIMCSSEGRKLSIDRTKFIAQNPLSVNMPIYFAEIFAEKPDAERKTIKFQVFKSAKSNVARQALRDFENAMKATAPAEIQHELKREFKEEEENEKSEEE